jgi:hypothetical protein
LEGRRQADRGTIYKGEMTLGRRNSKDVRHGAMSQKEMRRLERLKKNKNPRKDANDWTDRVLKKLTEGEPDA